MLFVIRELFQHMFWADAEMVKAIRSHPAAADDAELRRNLHHYVTVQRFFLTRFLDAPFDAAAEMQSPASFEDLERLFREAQPRESAFLEGLDEAGLAREIAMPRVPHLPEIRPSLGHALLQVALHSQHHRGQCASRLRALGGTPPTTDFILWLVGRPAPVW